jgi:DNA adenine methylase
LRKNRCYAEVYNDKWGEVVRVFRVLRDPVKSKELEQLLRLTPFARDEFDLASFEHIAGCSELEAVRLTIFRSFAGFGSASTNGKFSTGFRANSNRSGTTPAHDWVNYPDHLAAYVERLQGVIIENKDAIEVIEQHDGPQTFFYVDPPYPHSTRNMQRGNAAYECEMDDGEHARLAEVLHRVEGMVLISGYSCDLYSQLYGDWKTDEVAHFADGAKARTEVLWMNPAAERGQLQMEMEPEHEATK